MADTPKGKSSSPRRKTSAPSKQKAGTTKKAGKKTSKKTVKKTAVKSSAKKATAKKKSSAKKSRSVAVEKITAPVTAEEILVPETAPAEFGATAARQPAEADAMHPADLDFSNQAPEPEEFELTSALQDVAESLDLFKQETEPAVPYEAPVQPSPVSFPVSPVQARPVMPFPPPAGHADRALKWVFAAGLLLGLIVGWAM